jgi:hypothetical protein
MRRGVPRFTDEAACGSQPEDNVSNEAGAGWQTGGFG